MTYKHTDGRYYNRPRLMNNVDNSELWRVFPDSPGEIRKLPSVWLSWTIKLNQPPKNGYSMYGNQPYPTPVKLYSLDQAKTWVEFEDWGLKPGTNHALDVVLSTIHEEAASAKKEWFRARAKKKAQTRKRVEKAAAEKAGLDYDEFKKLKSSERARKLQNKKERVIAKKMAGTTNKKMSIGAELKDLLEVAIGLQSKLMSDTELCLYHVDSRLHKIREATRILEEWATEKK